MKGRVKGVSIENIYFCNYIFFVLLGVYVMVLK